MTKYGISKRTAMKLLSIDASLLQGIIVIQGSLRIVIYITILDTFTCNETPAEGIG